MITPEVRAQILQAVANGMAYAEAGRLHGANRNQVAGLVDRARKNGEFPGSTAAAVAQAAPPMQPVRTPPPMRIGGGAVGSTATPRALAGPSVALRPSGRSGRGAMSTGPSSTQGGRHDQR